MKKLLILLLCKKEGTYYDSLDDVLRPAYHISRFKFTIWILIFVATIVAVHILKGPDEAMITLGTIFVVSYTTAAYMANLEEIK